MILNIRSFDTYVAELPRELVRTCEMDIVHWANLSPQKVPFSIAKVDGGLVNGFFHMADPAAEAYVHDQQNAFYSKPAVGTVTASGAFEVDDNNIVDHDEVALIIGGHRNHWHFLVNFLPRLMMIEALFPDIIGAVDTIVFNDDPTSFQTDVIRRICKNANLTFISRNDRAWHRFRRIYFPSMVKNIEMNPFALRRSRTRLLNAFDITDEFGTEKGIFVDREYPTPRRRLANRSAIFKLLGERNIDPILCEKLSVREQILAFAKAPVVSGLHGAGMANLIFCRPDTPVIIIDYKWPSEMYALAATMGLKPFLLLAEQVIDSTYEAQTPKFQARLRDLKPDPKQIDAAICSAWLLVRR